MYIDDVYLFVILMYIDSPPPSGVMGCGVAEATGLAFVCFVINPLVVSNRVDFGLFVSSILQLYPPPPSLE